MVLTDGFLGLVVSLFAVSSAVGVFTPRTGFLISRIMLPCFEFLPKMTRPSDTKKFIILSGASRPMTRVIGSNHYERYETGRRVSLVHRPFERILLARVECLNVFVVESLFVNLDAPAKQYRLWKFLDCKTNGIGCRFEAAIGDLLRALAIAPRIQFGWCIIVKTVHAALQIAGRRYLFERTKYMWGAKGVFYRADKALSFG